MLELVAGFIAKLPGRIAALEAASAEPAAGELRTLAHQMKGAAGSYGFSQISEAARELEAALSEQRDGDASRALAALLSLCRRVTP
jgi:HPt (histidine-containing phosphotransfer) domain-containing protein